MSTNNECRFYPVQCTEETFKGLAAQEGHVYFVTDKKKLFLGKNNEMIPMCANSGIFYGCKEVEYVNDGNKPNPSVSFFEEELEGEDRPEVDDLILNIGTEAYPDGCFYRVNSVEDGVYNTTRLTLQGTGGGGGGGNTDPTAPSYSLAAIGTPYTFSSSAPDMNIRFKCTYLGSTEDYITSVSLQVKGESEPFYNVEKNFALNVEHSINITPYKEKFSSRKTVILTTQDAYGTVRSTNLSIAVINLS